MTHRYSKIKRILKRVYRKLIPVESSPWTSGLVEDICLINLIPPQKLISFFEDCIEKLEEVRGKGIGDYLEFGVFNGNSIGSMYFAAKKYNLNSIRLFGFDSFQGLPHGSENEDAGVWKAGFYACSFKKMQDCLRRRGIDPTEISFIHGWYEDTLTDKTAVKYQLINPGIIFVDCDTYSSAKKVLDFVKPLINKPCIICFDDWKLNNLDLAEMGEYQAYNEFLEANDHFISTEIRSYNRKSKTFILSPIFVERKLVTKKSKLAI